MSRFPGHIINLPANTPSQSSAPGVWTLKDQLVAQRNNQWPFQRDPDFRYTTLLLQGNVPNTTGPQAMNLPLAYNSDASSNNFLITPNGDVSPRPFSPYGGGNYSNGFDGAADFLGIANNALVQLTNATAFTIEAWVYPISIANNPQIVFAYNPSSPYQGYSLRILTSSGLFEMFDGTSWISFGAAQLNTWQHIAVSYEGNGTTRRFFINGVQQGPAITVPSTINWTSGGVNISSSGESFNGYISNLRIVKGTAVYTSNFTPPSQPLTAITNTSLLTCQSNRFIDNSGNNLTITRNGDVRVTDNSPFVSADFTTGSGYFNGASGSNLSFATGSFVFGNSDFTIEGWVYNTGTGTGSFFNGQYTSGASTTSIIGAIGSTNGNFDMYIGSSVYSLTGINPSVNQWVHLAIVRTGGTVSVFQNGNRTHTRSDLGTLSINAGGTTVAPQIGSSFLGYCSNHRIIIGSGPYDATQTSIPIPTAPLAVTANTKLLTLQTRAPSQNHGFIDSSPNEFIITRNGNVSQGTFSPFSPGGWGNYFNGSSNYRLTIPDSTDLDIAGDFCLEMWAYFTSTSGSNQLVCIGSESAAQNGFIFYQTNNSEVILYTNGSAAITTSSAGITANRWYHLALVRNGSGAGNTVIYVDGVSRGSAQITTSFTGLAANGLSIGQTYHVSYVGVLNAYLSNVRLVNGSPVYTGAFTPPTAPLTVIANTKLLTCQSNRFLDQTGKTLTVVGSPSVQAFSPFAPANSVSPLVTGGSGYFPSSATLTIPSAPALNLVGDFCMEGWAYPTATGFTFAWKYTGGNVGASEYWWVIDGTNQLSIALDGGGGEDYFRTAANTITLNAWNHCVLTRVGNEVRQFINGVLQSYNTTSRTLNATSTTFQTNGTLGYTSGFRIMKGSIPDAYRTTATTTGTTVFTPPTAPPVATQNTSLLLNFTNGGIVDATGKNVIETVGNAHVTAAQAKWDFQRGGAAPQFDGGTDCLFEASSPNYGFGTGDFTIEFWLRLNNTGTQTLVSNLTTASSVAPHLYYQLNSNIRYFTNGADRITGSALNANQWYHIAVCRSNGNTRLFVDGSQVGATYPDTNNYGTSNPLGVGDYGVPLNGASTLNGYISNLRVTKSARYAVNFNTNLPNGPFPIG